VSCIGSDMGKTVMNSNEAVTNQQINAIIVEMDDVCKDYVYHYLASKKDYLQKTGRS
jgi:type I restriction enzyme S subunit